MPTVNHRRHILLTPATSQKKNKKCSHYISFGISNDPALFLSFFSLKKKSSRADRLVLLFYLERENDVEMKYSKQTKEIHKKYEHINVGKSNRNTFKTERGRTEVGNRCVTPIFIIIFPFSFCFVLSLFTTHPNLF